MNKIKVEITCKYPGTGSSPPVHDSFLEARTLEGIAQVLRLSWEKLTECLSPDGPAYYSEAVDDGRAYYFIRKIED